MIRTRGAAVAACALLAAACGSTVGPSTVGPSTVGPSTGASTTGASTTGTSSADLAAASKVSLAVTFAASAHAPATHYTLRCEPAGGTASNPAAACARLLAGTSLFAPQPAHMLCPMIMASAGRATVTGTYFGKQVHNSIVDGGCDLSRWAKLKAVFS
jgi:hypothetical protein